MYLPSVGGCWSNCARPCPQAPTISLPGATPQRPRTTSQSSDTKPRAPQSQPLQSKETSRTSQQGSGWLGGLWNKLSLRPKNQMILPDDKNPSVSIAWFLFWMRVIFVWFSAWFSCCLNDALVPNIVAFTTLSPKWLRVRLFRKFIYHLFQRMSQWQSYEEYFRNFWR